MIGYASSDIIISGFGRWRCISQITDTNEMNPQNSRMSKAHKINETFQTISEARGQSIYIYLTRRSNKINTSRHCDTQTFY